MSHTLVTNCCLKPVCLNCSLELADHYEDSGPALHCIFCDYNVQNRYILRDPNPLEAQKIAQKCKETVKMIEKQKLLKA